MSLRHAIPPMAYGAARAKLVSTAARACRRGIISGSVQVAVPPALNRDDVAQGVISIITEVGPSAVTARALAARLHVAPATLYSVVPSLAAAHDRARELLGARFRGALVSIVSGDPRPAAAHLPAALNALDYLTSPTPEPITERVPGADVAAVPVALAVDRAAIFNACVRMRLTSEAVVTVFDQAEAALADAVRGEPAGEPAPVDQGRVDELSAGLREFLADDGERVRELRIASAVLVLGDGADQWSFRTMVERTGIALTTLHRLGERRRQLAIAHHDLSHVAAKRIADGASVQAGGLSDWIVRALEVFDDTRFLSLLAGLVAGQAPPPALDPAAFDPEGTVTAAGAIDLTQALTIASSVALGRSACGLAAHLPAVTGALVTEVAG